MMISRLGRRMPFLRTGKDSLTKALRLASHAKKMHQKDTSMNWMMVKVTGLGRAVKMALDDVLVMIEVMYQKPHRDFTERSAEKMRWWKGVRL